jgi:hypothetical protein
MPCLSFTLLLLTASLLRFLLLLLVVAATVDVLWCANAPHSACQRCY